MVHNPAHAPNKRKPAPVADSGEESARAVAVVREVDPLAFNFTKTRREEHLMALWSRPDETSRIALEFRALDNTEADFPRERGPDPDGPSHTHAVLINASPFLPSQSLFVPSAGDLLPQVASPYALAFSAAVSRLSASPDFKLGFNSLGAHASVNHCHWHGFYVRPLLGEDDTPLEASPRTALASRDGVELSELSLYPAPAFHLSAPSEEVVGFLISSNIPHQLLWVRQGTGLFVIPRQPQAILNDGKINMALAELVGIGMWTDAEGYASATFSDYVSMMRAVSLSGPEYSALRAHVLSLWDS